jgi:hypothetical protein
MIKFNKTFYNTTEIITNYISSVIYDHRRGFALYLHKSYWIEGSIVNEQHENIEQKVNAIFMHPSYRNYYETS